MSITKAGPHKCKTHGCKEILSSRRVYCCACTYKRHLASARKTMLKRSKFKPDSQEYANTQNRPPRWFSGRIVTVVNDPSEYPLAPGLVLDRYATSTMAAFGCFTNGLQLLDHSSEQIYTVTGVKGE